MSDRLRLRSVDPKRIQIPSVRITSVWDPDEYEVFKASLEADGIANPIICVKEGETYWLADGLHRLQEAVLRGDPRIQIAYKEGTIMDAKLRNLYLDRLRGRTKVTEEIAVIRSLQDDDGLSLNEIQDRTGLSRELLEQRVAIGSAHPLIIEALDQESIGVGVAYHLSRLPNPEGQVALLTRFMAMIPKPTTQWVRDIIDDALEYQRLMREHPEEPQAIIPVKTLSCALCDQKYEARDVAGFNICRTCYGLARDWIQRRLKEQTGAESPESLLAKQIATAGPNTGDSEPDKPGHGAN